MRRFQGHLALHQADVEVEVARLAVVDDEGLGVAFVEQLGAQFAGPSPGWFEHHDRAGLDLERAGEFVEFQARVLVRQVGCVQHEHVLVASRCVEPSEG